MVDQKWYYWSDVERNTLGEDLETCAKKYGLWDSRTLPDADDWARKDMQISGIYMSKERTNGYSWALTMKQYSSKKTVILSTFEKCPTTYRKPGIFRLQPDPAASTAQCLLCGKESEKKCSRCRASYCSALCQKSHWVVHKEVCASTT
jgi:hypothetical protein